MHQTNKPKIAIVSRTSDSKYLCVSVYNRLRRRYLHDTERFTKEFIYAGIVANYSQRCDCECYFINDYKFTDGIGTLNQEIETFVKLAGIRYSSPMNLYNDHFGENNE